MAHTTVRDVVIWTKHVHGGNAAERLASLPGEAEVTLVVDGVRGRWCKMRNGKDGRATPGLRPVGRAQSFWQSLFDSRRGESVTLEIEGDAADGVEEAPTAFRPIRGQLVVSEAERQAAIQAILSAPGHGWRSEGRKVTRDELYDR